MMADRLALAGLTPFAKGDKRHCYVHPDDPATCVKVAADPDDEGCRRAQREDIEDHAWLKAHKPATVFERIPETVATVDTDRGLGIAQRLYRDADGRVSGSLTAVVHEHGLTPALVDAIGDWKNWLRAQRLPLRDPAPYNLVAVRDEAGRYKLCIVEGWADRKYRRLALHSRFCASRVLGRKLAKFDRRLLGALGKPA